MGLVDILRVMVKSAPMLRHDDIFLESQHKELLSIDFKPDVDLASIEVNNFCKVIKLIIHDDVS